MERFITWLEGIARHHLLPRQTLTSPQEKQEVEGGLENYKQSVADLEQQVIELATQLALRASDEEKAREEYEEWKKRSDR